MKKIKIIAIMLFILGSQSNLLPMIKPEEKQSQINQGFIHATKEGNLESVKKYLSRSANINTQDNEGETALMHAASKGFTSIVALLLARGANMNIQNIQNIQNMGWTALMPAAINGHVEIVDLFLARNARTEIRTTEGWTALNCAVRGKIMPQRSEKLTLLSLNYNNSYLKSFSNFLKSGELTDTNLPHDLKAHKTILVARLGENAFNKLNKVLSEKSKEQAAFFLYWVYSGLIKEGKRNLIDIICQNLDIADYAAKTGFVGFRSDLERLYNSREEAGDFTIIINGVDVKVHKTILAARSGLFRDMFLNVTDESNRVTDRSELSLDAFNAIIEFIYTGQIKNLTKEIAEELKETDAQEYFQLPKKDLGELQVYLGRYLDPRRFGGYKGFLY